MVRRLAVGCLRQNLRVACRRRPLGEFNRCLGSQHYDHATLSREPGLLIPTPPLERPRGSLSDEADDRLERTAAEVGPAAGLQRSAFVQQRR